ncbi:MAG: hypothetical protein JW953_21215 [Anaerolineae bacterium]|nr:hypothetical protein [Anaerolineae bacterium]
MLKTEVSTTMIWTFMLGLVSIMLLSAGQTSIKVGLNAIGGVSLSEGLPGLLKLMHTPWVIVGFALYGFSAILWMDVLSKLDFSLAFPMVALTYVFTLLIGRFFFGEYVGWERILGVAFILFGVFFLVRSGNLVDG